MAAKFKKGDTVMVIAGKDKGLRGEILSMLPKRDRVVVQGAGIVKRHRKPTANDQGGIVEEPRPIHISNVSHLDPKDQKPVRIGFKMESDKKVRFSKRSKEIIK